MTQPDDPFGKGNRTVIRPRPGGSPGPERTVISQQPFGQPAQRPGAPAHWDSTPSPGPAATGSSSQDWVSQRSPDYVDPRNRAPVQRPRNRMPLVSAINAQAQVEVKATNPIVQEAVPLLVLLGRLRQLVVEMDAVPLMQHVSRSISDLERNLLGRGIDQEQVTIAKYTLCATADDIVQNLPDGDRHVWVQHSMLAQYFNVRTSGTVLFEKIRQLTANPTVYYNLLELIHACLSLGFEGQFRTSQGGDIELQRVRRDVFQTLRMVRSRSDDGLSPRWRGVDTMLRRLRDGIPVWAMAAIAAAILAGLYILLRFLISGEGDTVAERYVKLHPGAPVVLSRTQFEPLPETPYVVDTTQLERIRGVLAPEIAEGSVTVEPVGESIVMGVNNVLLFDSGSADVRADFAALAERIAASLDNEPGSINIVGHTDNVKLRATSRFKSNYDLSVKRAESVAAVIESLISDPSRISVSGRGEDDPVAANDTAEGRAKNRRVDITIPREETL